MWLLIYADVFSYVYLYNDAKFFITFSKCNVLGLGTETWSNFSGETWFNEDLN